MKGHKKLQPHYHTTFQLNLSYMIYDISITYIIYFHTKHILSSQIKIKPTALLFSTFPTKPTSSRRFSNNLFLFISQTRKPHLYPTHRAPISLFARWHSHVRRETFDKTLVGPLQEGRHSRQTSVQHLANRTRQLRSRFDSNSRSGREKSSAHHQRVVSIR